MSGRNRVPSLKLARLSTSDRINLTSTGNIIYNTDISKIEIYEETNTTDVSGWRKIITNDNDTIDISCNKLLINGDISLNGVIDVQKLINLPDFSVNVSELVDGDTIKWDGTRWIRHSMGGGGNANMQHMSNSTDAKTRWEEDVKTALQNMEPTANSGDIEGDICIGFFYRGTTGLGTSTQYGHHIRITEDDDILIQGRKFYVCPRNAWYVGGTSLGNYKNWSPGGSPNVTANDEPSQSTSQLFVDYPYDPDPNIVTAFPPPSNQYMFKNVVRVRFEGWNGY